jgi:hypothetical protein
MGFRMTFDDSGRRGRSNFDRDVAPDPRSTVTDSTVTESAFAKLSFASGNGEMLASGV